MSFGPNSVLAASLGKYYFASKWQMISVGVSGAMLGIEGIVKTVKLWRSQ